MGQHVEGPATKRLAALVGEWSMVAEFEGAPPADGGARVVFEWMRGERFLIQRWEAPIPEHLDAPSAGIATIGPDPESEGNFLQHYFDSRGVARVYKMSLTDGVWKLWRDTPDFSPLNFSQRYTGSFGDDGLTITGSWEICHDGTTWEHDFDLTYFKVRRAAHDALALGDASVLPARHARKAVARRPPVRLTARRRRRP